MLVLIETDIDGISLDVSFAGYCGVMQKNWSSKVYEVKKVPVEALSVALIGNKDVVLPIGSVEYVRRAADLLGVELPSPLNVPSDLAPYVGRKIWTAQRSELSFPCFVKPLEEVKLFTGFVAKSQESFANYPELKDWQGMCFCSEPIGEILSEWRCYVLEGKVFNCSNYNGDSLVFPDKNEIQYLVSLYKNAPIGYSLDVAVTKTGTKLIECNDAWALGYYGGDFGDYFKMVKARWLQILRSK